MASLGRMLSAIEAKCAPEKNIFLVGDFNLPPEEAPWRGQNNNGGFVPLIDHPDTTTIYGSLYDNFWVPENTHAKESGVMYIDHEFFPDSKEPYKSPKAKAARKICNKVNNSVLLTQLFNLTPFFLSNCISFHCGTSFAGIVRSSTSICYV